MMLGSYKENVFIQYISSTASDAKCCCEQLLQFSITWCFKGILKIYLHVPLASDKFWCGAQTNIASARDSNFVSAKNGLLKITVYLSYNDCTVNTFNI